MTSESEQSSAITEGMIRQTLGNPRLVDKPHYRSLDELSKTQNARPKRFHAWVNRAKPILERMIANGHGVDMRELHQTLDLLVAHLEKDSGALDPSVAHKSHLARVSTPTLDSTEQKACSREG